MSTFFNYLHTISKINSLANSLDIQWIFHCGMLFASDQKWWGDFKLRHCPHEGIDISFYRTDSDKMHCFDNSIKVPAMDEGIILNICDDFLGKTIVVEQKNLNSFKKKVLFAYAHTIPEKGLKSGDIIRKHNIIAKVCNTDKNPQLKPHIHFSCFEVPKQLQSFDLNWNLLSKSLDINQINPIFL